MKHPPARDLGTDQMDWPPTGGAKAQIRWTAPSRQGAWG